MSVTEGCVSFLLSFIAQTCHVSCVLMFRMGSALLSRFDLVFILLDKPDEVMPRILLRLTFVLHPLISVVEAVQPYKNFVSVFLLRPHTSLCCQVPL